MPDQDVLAAIRRWKHWLDKAPRIQYTDHLRRDQLLRLEVDGHEVLVLHRDHRQLVREHFPWMREMPSPPPVPPRPRPEPMTPGRTRRARLRSLVLDTWAPLRILAGAVLTSAVLIAAVVVVTWLIGK